eukprot:TRINITY_DN305_c0_g1_i1.p1 TRINITY_DN305_c0_g1~~TRINITY_DN305_c0_g1_i1.p1  ORF type:complete len:432 (-),score=32.64 TRINITY_DN305_c0_g1_i1:725-1936(-)
MVTQLYGSTKLGLYQKQTQQKVVLFYPQRFNQSRQIKEFSVHASTLQTLDNSGSNMISEDKDETKQFLGWRDDFQNYYKLQQEIGKGNFGVVHSAVDLSTNEEVAVKILPKTRDQILPFVSLFKVRNEVENFLAAQGCPSVARLHGCFEDDTNAYLVMEMCRGGDLKDLLDVHGCFSERESAIVLCQVFMAIEACHRRKVCFGDIKPANFLLKDIRDHSRDKEEQSLEDLSIRAVDFGCSQRIIANEHLTKITGTPLYMAPEMFMRDYGLEVDMWAAGILLYQLLTNLPPFWKSWQELRGTNQNDLILDIMSNPILFEQSIWESISEDAKDLVRSCLQRLPQKRLKPSEALQHPFIQTHCDIKSFQLQQQDEFCQLDDEGLIICSNIVESGFSGKQDQVQTIQ